MKIIHLLSFLLILIQQIFSSKIITLPLEDKLVPNLNNSRLYFNLTSSASVSLDTWRDISQINLDYFLSQFPKDSPPKPIKEFPNLSGEGNYSIYHIPLSFWNLSKLITFEFVDYKNNQQKQEEIEFISFAHYSYIKEKLLLSQLFYNELIPANQFGIDLNNKNTNQYIYLGGIPKDRLSQKIKNVISFDVMDHVHIWKIEINSIGFGPEIYNIYNNCFIDFDRKDILLKEDIYNQLITAHFQTYLSNNECWIDEISEDNKLLFCFKKVVDELPSFYFYLKDEVPLLLKKESLFSCTNEHKCKLNMNIQKMFEQWTSIGYTFFKDYVTLFDYDKNTITMYEIEPNETMFIFNLKQIKLYLMFIIYGIFVIGLIILLYLMNYIQKQLTL